MMTKEEEFLKRLQAVFHVEAEEHINVLSSGLIALEKNPHNVMSLELIETIFREAHSLKGAARSVNRKDIESLCQALESLFAKWKDKQIASSAEQFDVVHQSLDTLSAMISGTEPKSVDDGREVIRTLLSMTDNTGNKTKHEATRSKRASRGTKDHAQPVNEMVVGKQSLNETIQSGESAQGALPARSAIVSVESVEEKPPQWETVRIQTSKLEPLFLQAEQMIQSKIASIQRSVELKNICHVVGTWKAESRKLESRRYSDSGLQAREIIQWTNEQLDETERSIQAVTDAIESDQRSLGRMIDDHVESMKNILMVPVSTVIEVFPRLVRDLSRSQGKEVELVIHGKEIEVDKRIVEELKDPLMHLLRNCIDHGIAKPEERLGRRQTSHGTITLTCTVIDGRNLEIRIADDGIGIDVDKVIEAALNAGIVSKAAVRKMSKDESMDMIFHSGITTNGIITDISGRGLGLAIVREKVENLGGKVYVESQADIGTAFRLVLPLALSTVRGVLVKASERFFLIPTGNVERALRVSSEEIKTVEKRETLVIDQAGIMLTELRDVLHLHDKPNALLAQKGTTPPPRFVYVVVLAQGTNRIGFKVDEIIDEQQILIKPLGRQLKSVRNISGAAVLGSGTVVPVIHVSDVMKSAWDHIATGRTTQYEIQTEAQVSRVLVIDDSVTSRTHLKNTLEFAGYNVITAVDGVDALTKALAGEFDLIVSDVDMPRMNGFELTARIRKDKRLSKVPVVLVTALESTEDRQHGIDVGANAYIAKSSFDQSNLLDVIKTLL